MRDPYRAAGLERNPFVAESWPGVDPHLWIDRGLPDRLETQPRHLVQVLGPKGAGKTSHLLRWRTAAPGPYRHVPPGPGRFGLLPLGPVVYWDEADRAAWLRLGLGLQALRGGMVVAGSHRDLTSAAEALGMTVETFELGAVAEADVARFAARRIDAVGGDPAAWNDLPYRDVAETAGSSLRLAGHLLHIQTARRVAGRPVSPE